MNLFFLSPRKIALLLLTGLCFFFCFEVQKGMNLQRKEAGLTRVAPLENAPPVLAFTTVALGGFRGLIANVLWMRANDLEEEGKFFESLQLADWITKLQPRLGSVWVLQAWNLSWNISMNFTDPETRWQWVKRGMELLRDQGMKYDPGDPLIYRELSGIFQERIGSKTDAAHLYFKKKWAEEMEGLLGPGRPNFEALKHPKTPKEQERAQALRQKYGMSPARMEEVDQRYGPLDWRLPEAHSIYWASQGLEENESAPNSHLQELSRSMALQKEKDGDENNSMEKKLQQLNRTIYQSLLDAFQHGRLVENKEAGVFDLLPNIDLASKVNEVMEGMMSQNPKLQADFSVAHQNFLKDAIWACYVNNREAEARHWFQLLKEEHPDAVPPEQTLGDFSLEHVTRVSESATHERVLMVIEGLVGRSFYNLSLGEHDHAVSYDRLAKACWQHYQVRLTEKSEGRLALPPMEQVKKDVLDRMLKPGSGFHPQLAARLRTELNLPP